MLYPPPVRRTKPAWRRNVGLIVTLSLAAFSITLSTLGLVLAAGYGN